MKLFKTFLLPILIASATISCNNAPKNQETTSQVAVAVVDSTNQISETKAADEAKKEVALTLSAMFIDFTLGDAEHYTFKDKTGKIWDFGGCDDENIKFYVELPEAQSNEDNRGFASNKTVQNKWFDLKYVIRDQPEYQDGPMAKVPVIIEAKMQK